MLTGKEDIVRAITEALALEKGTREFYQFAATKVSNKSARDIFSVLRDMEERHMRYLDFLYLSVSEDRDLLGYKDFSSSVTATHIESGVSARDAMKLFEEQEIKTAKDALKVAFEEMIKGKLNCTVECNPLLGPAAFDAAEKILSGEKVDKIQRIKDEVFDQSTAKDVIDSRQY